MPAVHSSPSPISSTSWLRKDFGRNGPLSVLIQISRQSRFACLLHERSTTYLLLSRSYSGFATEPMISEALRQERLQVYAYGFPFNQIDDEPRCDRSLCQTIMPMAEGVDHTSVPSGGSDHRQ